jgi:hypothetical protein
VKNMGIRSKNDQPILVFTCVQCKSRNKRDFRYYPLCKKCNKFNQRIDKRNNNGHSEEEKED